ncbi:hypothetical protein [Salinibaculum rarum]|uniref:hypothetical protein n=1 Tax=Salinibaculum rarum TaxID=3058903 RepID=UPI0026601D48|nr:hypothetical protein [Salinibaculum sp. KK48]
MSTDTTHPDGAELTVDDITSRSTTHSTVRLINPDSARNELVTCLECGKSADLSTRRERNVGRTIERFDERDCTDYEFPTDVSVGDHSIAVSIEVKRKERIAVCTQCGRRTRLRTGDHDLEYLGRKPCDDDFTEDELVGALSHNLSYHADYNAIGIGNWSCGTGNGWGRNIKSILGHSSLPVYIITKQHRSGNYTVSVQSGKDRYSETYDHFDADSDAELETRLLDLLPVMVLLNDCDAGIIDDIKDRAAEINDMRHDAWIAEAYETARATFDMKFSDTSITDLNDAFKDADEPVDEKEVLRRVFGPNARFNDVSERDFATNVLSEESEPEFITIFDVLKQAAGNDETYSPNTTVPTFGTDLNAETVFAFGPAADTITNLDMPDEDS